MTGGGAPTSGHDERGFTLIETLVALVVFSSAILMFERTVAGAWHGIGAANARTGAVTLAQRLLEQAGIEVPLAGGGEADGESGRYQWHRLVEPLDAAAGPPAAGSNDILSYLVSVDVSWRDTAIASAHAVHFRAIKLERRTR